MHITGNKKRAQSKQIKSHVGQLVIDLAIQEGSLVAGERGLQALLDEDAN